MAANIKTEKQIQNKITTDVRSSNHDGNQYIKITLPKGININNKINQKPVVKFSNNESVSGIPKIQQWSIGGVISLQV